MKISRLFLPILLVASLSPLALAQGHDGLPPKCCSSPVPDEDSKPQSRDAQMKVAISDAMLSAIRVTRGEFLDRLAAALFGGRPTYVVLSSTNIVRNHQRESMSSGAAEALVAVQIRRLYQFSKDQVTTEDLDSLDQLYLTDGEVYLDVQFQRNPSWTTSFRDDR
jgi:hypothetical protein